MSLIKKILLFLLVVTCVGCNTTYRRSPNFGAALPSLKTVAVLPPDVRVYQISAGGVSEEMDEWSAQAKTNIEKSLKKYLGGGTQSNLELKFIAEDWIKANLKDEWRQQKAMYEAVAAGVIRHTYSPTENFQDKIKNFDYSMGAEVGNLAREIGSDGLIFITGSDAQETGGRMAVNFLRAAVLGVYVYNPSFLSLGLVDGKTGDLLWFNVTLGTQDYNFLNPKHIDSIIQWITKDFIVQPQ
jgi:hypothetical protein